MLGLILNEHSLQFNGENYLQTHGTAMGTKMAVSFANIFMAKIETTLIRQSETKPKEWRRYIHDIFSNSLIIHEEKTKEITTVKEVWICDPNYHKMRRSFALIFSKNYQCFEKLYQTLERVFHQISKHFEVG